MTARSLRDERRPRPSPAERLRALRPRRLKAELRYWFRADLRRWYAIRGVLLGTAVLAVLSRFQDLPDLRLVALFAAIFAYLEWHSPQVNDRLRMSAGIMVLLTAGVVAGRGSAALTMATIAAFGLLVPKDIAYRRWFQPAFNFGQMIVSAAGAGLVLDALLPAEPAFSFWDVGRIAGAVALASAMYVFLNVGQVQSVVRRLYVTFRDVRPWSGMRTLIPSSFAMGVLGGLLGVVYLALGPAMLPLILIVFVIGQLNMISYAELREAHESTVRGFVKSLEAKDLYTRGHTERVAHFAQLIGEEMGFDADQLEKLRWAALIHDVGKLAVPRYLIRKRGALTPEEYAEMRAHAHLIEDILAEVRFLAPMVEIASGHHARYDGTGYGGTGHREGEPPSIEASILAAADAFDAMTSSRSYRVALSQDYAISELEANRGTQFHPEVVDAFLRILRRGYQGWGSSIIHDEKMARRLAEHRIPARSRRG